MRALPFVALAACGGSGHPTLPDGSSPSDTGISIPADAIVIDTDLPPIVVVFREGTTGSWQAATQVTATRFEAEPHGPFEVAVQCSDSQGGLFQTVELARTLDDPHDITIRCGVGSVPPQPWTVSGRIVQPGQVWFATGFDMSSAANWSYSFGATTGTYDVMAMTATDIAFRRGLDVHGDLGVSPDIDMTHEGAPLVATAFTVIGALPAESTSALVKLDDGTLYPQLYNGPPATAVVAPDSVLIATNRQSATMIATDGIHSRALLRGFRAGDSTAFTLPAPGDLQVAVQAGRVMASWTSLLPDFETFDVSVTCEGSPWQPELDLQMTPAFEAATQLRQLAIDNDIPGYDVSHGASFSGPCGYQTYQEHVAGDQVMSAWSEDYLH